MRLTVPSCPHRCLLEYQGRSLSEKDDCVHATCRDCYRRLRLRFDTAIGRAVVLPDLPTVMCSHTHKRPISEAATRRLPYLDAICTSCGSVLRHPDGPGGWTEVMFYGLLIKEEPI